MSIILPSAGPPINIAVSVFVTPPSVLSLSGQHSMHNESRPLHHWPIPITWPQPSGFTGGLASSGRSSCSQPESFDRFSAHTQPQESLPTCRRLQSVTRSTVTFILIAFGPQPNCSDAGMVSMISASSYSGSKR